MCFGTWTRNQTLLKTPVKISLGRVFFYKYSLSQLTTLNPYTLFWPPIADKSQSVTSPAILVGFFCDETCV